MVCFIIGKNEKYVMRDGVRAKHGMDGLTCSEMGRVVDKLTKGFKKCLNGKITRHQGGDSK